MKFLDLAGVQSLWNAIKAETAKSKTTLTEEKGTGKGTAAYVYVKGAAVEGAGEDGHVNYVVELRNAASTKDVQDAKEAIYGGSIPASGAETITSLDQRIDALETESDVTVEKLATAESGYAASYVVKQNNTQVGATINIPKDFLVKSATLEVVSAADTPYAGAKVNDKYIDFVVNTTDASETAQHIYLPVQDLVDAYTAGNGLQMENNKFSVKLDSTSEEFLTVGANGVKLSGVQSAIDTAKSAVIGASTDAASADTIKGAKAYADTAVTAAAGNYATAAQGLTADSALQSVSNGTDGNYVTTTIEAKDTNNNQTIGVAVTIQPVDTASASAQGLVEASDVKAYIDNAVSTGTSNGAHKVDNATAGNFAGLDSNGDLTDSGKKAADFATAAQGALADSAIQSVTGETAVTNSNYVNVSVEAATTGTDVTLTSHANVTTHTVSDAAVGTADGLATAADVKSYVDDQKTAVDTAIAAMDADLDASGTPDHNGVFVMSGVTQVDGTITAVGSVEVEKAGAAAAVKTELLGDATTTGNTLGKLEDRLETLEGSGSVDSRITTAIQALDSDVNVAASASEGHVVTTPASNDGTTSTHVTPATVLTSLTITDGKFSAATSQKIEAINYSDLAGILVLPNA